MRRNYRAMPIYRESGYARKLPPMSPIGRIACMVCTALLPLSLILSALARYNPQIVERYYSLGFYKVAARTVSGLSGLFPFSLAEWLIIAFAVVCIIALVVFFLQLARYRQRRGRVTVRFAARCLAAGGVLVMLFTMLGGLNYYRHSFTHHSGLEVRPSEVSQLAELCTELANRANILRTQLPEDENGVSVITGDFASLASAANESYRAMSADKPQWQPLFGLAETARAKPVFFSQAMSYMQIVGVYFPYTVEANINVHTTDFDIPNAICHELAHVAGFMREDEANFISYLACTSSDDPMFAYSGVMLAFIHSSNALYSYSSELYSQAVSVLSPEVLRDLAADSQYYDEHYTRFGSFSNSVNDVYLKVNNQRDGVAGYGRMVDLLLADYRQRHNIA